MRQEYISNIIMRDIGSSAELTKAEARNVMLELEKLKEKSDGSKDKS